MVKTLYVFLFSPIVDSYINAIAYSFDIFEIKAVHLIYIKDTETGLNDSEAKDLSISIWKRISELSKSYGDVYKLIHKKLPQFHYQSINYSIMRNEMEKLLGKSKEKRNSIIDITGTPKGPAIEIFTVCFSLGIKSVYTFELFDKVDINNPENSLYHKLNPNQYIYRCIYESIPIKISQSTMVRKSLLMIYVVIFSLLLMIVSLYSIIYMRLDNVIIKIINLLASITGLITPIIAFFKKDKF